MAPEQIEAERVVFEAWAKIEGKNRGCGWKLPQFLRTDSGHYVAGWTAALWDGWLTRAELAHAERREMQETEQRLRAEIARLQAVADRAVPDALVKWANATPPDEMPSSWREGYNNARSWVAAQLAAVPDGWKLVPAYPTEAMLEKGELAYWQKERDMCSPTPTEEPGIGAAGYCYLAMIAAAPQPEAPVRDSQLWRSADSDPPESGLYLVQIGGQSHVAKFSLNTVTAKWWSAYGVPSKLVRLPSHWMPLPSEPDQQDDTP